MLRNFQLVVEDVAFPVSERKTILIRELFIKYS